MAITEIKIEGIDTEAGIKRFAGKAEIYIKSLTKFALQYKEASAPADKDELKSFAHQIKGVAANLGINELSAVAAETEKNLGDGFLLIDKLHETCAVILSEVDAPTPAAEIKTNVVQGSESEYKALISQLSGALKVCNYTQSKNSINELSAKAWAGVKTPDFKALTDLIEKYDFDGALALI